MLSPAVENLVAQLSRLPGVGTRTAHRLAFHLLQRPKDEALALATAIEDVKERVRFCNECGNLTEEDVCAICRDARRDHTMICVVEQPVDLISVERTSEFRGLYHVLGGALSPLDGVEPEHLRIDELLWGERAVRSVANLSRRDGEEFLALAPRVPVRTQVRSFALEQANEAIDHLRRGEVHGSAVLHLSAAG